MEDHPLARERLAEEQHRAACSLRRAILRERSRRRSGSGGTGRSGAARGTRPAGATGQIATATTANRPPLPDVSVVKALLPPITHFTGGAGLVIHPVYGSSTGGNLSVDAAGDRWYCFHKGSEGGGDVLKWLAVYELGLIREDEDLRGENFVKTVRYVVERYGGTRQ